MKLRDFQKMLDKIVEEVSDDTEVYIEHPFDGRGGTTHQTPSNLKVFGRIQLQVLNLY
jgi:hypothetical protein